MSLSQSEAPLTDEETKELRKFLEIKPQLLKKMEQLEEEVKEKDARIAGLEIVDKEKEARIADLEIVDKEKEILLKLQGEEKSARNDLRRFHEEFYHPTTWEPQFDDVKEMATRHLVQFMRTLNAPEESVEKKKELLEERLNMYKERTQNRQKEIKASTMLQLEHKMAGDFWVLRVEEKHGKARGEIMTPELYKDEEVVKLLESLKKKCERRRWGITLAFSIPTGVIAGKAVGIGLAVSGVCAVGPAALIGLGAGVVVVLAVVGGMQIYAHWPKIKELPSACVDKIKQKFSKNSEFENLEELTEELNKAVTAEHPQYGSVVFI